MKIGERMKQYEEGEVKFDGNKPVIARIDGRAFHTFTKGLTKPFHRGFMNTMIMTARDLMNETHAVCAYVQSDEISLVFYAPMPWSQIYFAGRKDKMNSVLASQATYSFNQLKNVLIPERLSTPALFDCRTFEVPDKTEAVNYLIWRYMDCMRNSVNVLAHCTFGHKHCQGKNPVVLKKELDEAGSSWYDLGMKERFGTFLRQDGSRYTSTFINDLMENKIRFVFGD